MKVLDELKFRIPKEILNVAFASELANTRRAPFSLDNEIMIKVIRPRVLTDANLVGGQIVDIPLEGIAPEYVDNVSVIYEIPADRVMYRTIMSVLSVVNMGYVPSLGNNLNGSGIMTVGVSGDVMNAGQRVLNSQSSIPNFSNAKVDLIGHNTVLIRNAQQLATAFQIRCVIGNEDNLSNFNPRYYLQFSRLIEYAVKSFIYNSLIIKIDQAFLLGGQDLGSVRTYVESLSDAEQMYQDYLANVIQKISLMNNTSSHEKFIRVQVNPAL